MIMQLFFLAACGGFLLSFSNEWKIDFEEKITYVCVKLFYASTV
jgi:hypothetical protein